MKLRAPSRAASTLTVGTIVLVATTIFAQQLTEPQALDQKIAAQVCAMLTDNHISRSPLNDGISERLLARYLKELDPQKLYFQQADVAKLQQDRHRLDDQVRGGNVDFAYKTFQMYLDRLDRWVALVDELIDAEHDFTLDETMVVDAEELDWAKDDDALRERWRKRIKYELLSKKLEDEDTTLDEAREQLHKRYKNVRQMMHQTDDMEQLEIYLSALAHCFDPHSSYMSPNTLEDFQIAMRLRLQGIGAALRWEDGFTIVANIVKGGAAEQDGRLKVGDKIIGVDNGDGEMTDVVEMKLTRVVRLIRGPKGTQVRLKVKPADGGDVAVYQMTRQIIQLDDTQAVKGTIYKSNDRLAGTNLRVGVINIPSFYRDFAGAQQGQRDFKSTARDVLQVLKDFHEQGGVDVVIVDLRSNGGGALVEAIEVSGLFIDQGPVVQVQEPAGEPKIHEDTDSGAVYDGPLVVLCNRLSASASEIFAGVIQDYKRGIVVGDSATHGKGTVQNVMMVGGRQLFRFLNPENRGALKVTINQFYRVNGDSTQSRGVQSDIVLPSMMDQLDLGESFLDNALEFNRIDAAGFDPEDKVSRQVVDALKQSSQGRVAKDEKFAELRQDIERYLARKKRKTISLNEEVLRKERAEDKQDEDDKSPDGTTDDGTDEENTEVFPDHYYNNEVLHIAVDYAKLLQGIATANN